MSTGPLVTLSPRDFDAVLFDLDGVLTRTASVHASAWQKLFDDFLQQRSASTGEPFVPFDKTCDYLRYVDGRPRYEGVATFLEARGIDLPLGSPDDGPEARSVYGLGNLKDQILQRILATTRCRRLRSGDRVGPQPAQSGRQNRRRIFEQ